MTYSKAAFSCEAYSRLSGDCSASIPLSEKEVDERISQLLDDEDPDLVLDLCVTNKGMPETYRTFLDVCRRYIDIQIDTAVDDRRHGTVTSGDVVTSLAQQ